MTRFLPTVSKFASLALIAGAVAAPSFADRSVTNTVKFTFDEAQLSSTTNAAGVLADLNAQAEDACSFVEPILRTDRVDDACVADVMRQAVLAINEPTLTEAYNIAEGRQVAPAVRAAAAETEVR